MYNEQAIAFKEKYKLNEFYETSSKNGENNKLIFTTLTRLILQKRGLLN